MTAKQFDVIIVGGGMVGLSAALSLARASLRVAVVEAKTPVLTWDDTDYTARVSAINLGSYAFLQGIDVWSSIKANSIARLCGMRVWVLDGQVEFDALDIGKNELGFIVENRAIVAALWQCLQQHDNVELLEQTQLASLTREPHCVRVTLSNKAELSATLLLGADGAHSVVREHLATTVKQRSYYQDAIVAMIKTHEPHRNIAYQHFLSTGPLGVLPAHPSHEMSIVWSNHSARADELMQMSDKAFNLALTNALDGKLGMLSLLSKRVKIPLVMRHVDHYVGERIALLGDAAHTIHPLAGQGVNLGFSDAACLTELIIQAHLAKQDIGRLTLLRCYERARKSDNTMVLMLMRAFKEGFSNDIPLLAPIKSQSLHITNRFAQLKQFFMRYAIGV